MWQAEIIRGIKATYQNLRLPLLNDCHGTLKHGLAFNPFTSDRMNRRTSYDVNWSLRNQLLKSVENSRALEQSNRKAQEGKIMPTILWCARTSYDARVVLRVANDERLQEC